jgi:hypothetical protein
MTLVVGVIFFTPNAILLQKLTAHAFEAVLLFLLSALFFMLFNRPRIMFTCLGLCAILCLYLKDKSNSGIQKIFDRRTNDFSLCQVLINGGADEYESISRSLINSRADIISIQELTPDWALVLKDALSPTYPYHTELNRIDPYGMAVFSKYPMRKIDTIMYEDSAISYQIPALRLEIEIGSNTVDLISAHVLPRMNNVDFMKVQGFLDTLADWAKNKKGQHIMIAGDLGVTPWDFVLQKLISTSGLRLSRREPHLFIQPFEHILYSSSINCNQLKEVLTMSRNHIGILGDYSFIRPEQDPGFPTTNQ